MTLLDRIRAASRAVAAHARHVRIDASRLGEYAAALAGDPLDASPLDPRHHFLEPRRRAATVAYVVTLAAVNFGSGYFPHLRPRARLTGYPLVAAAVRDRFRTAGPWSAAELARLRPADCAEVFGQRPAGPAGDLMVLFSRALNQLGRHVGRRFDGRFEALVESAAGSAERLVEHLATLPSFRDVARYGRRAVPFFKRAQLMAADLATAFGGRGPGAFDDLHRLTVFADNTVPHVLRIDGVLRYAAALAARIDAGTPIARGSADEVEIRAATVEAVERLVEQMAGRGRRVHAAALDAFLWTRGQRPAYRRRRPHRTLTTAY